MANIALPRIRDALGYDEGSLQWVLTAYALTVGSSTRETCSFLPWLTKVRMQFGGFLMAGGRLGDIFGHRNVLIFGMTLFNLSTLLCALVNDKIGLVIGRALQGMLAGLCRRRDVIVPGLVLTCFVPPLS